MVSNVNSKIKNAFVAANDYHVTKNNFYGFYGQKHFNEIQSFERRFENDKWHFIF